MDSNEKMYSVKEFGGETAWSCDTVRRRIRNGQIRAFKLPSAQRAQKRQYECYRIPESELRKWKLK